MPGTKWHSAVVSRLGRDPQGEFSFQRFLTAYGNLSPEGRRILFRSTGKDNLARSLDDIAFVTKELQEKLLKFYNPSGTGKSVSRYKDGDGYSAPPG